MARLQTQFREKIAPALIEKFGYTTPMQVPRITKITLNMGVSEAVADKKVMDNAVGDMTKIAGQKPVVTKAKKAIAGFKIREDLPIGCMVTLRGVQMYEFLDRFVMLLCRAFVTFAEFLAEPLMDAAITTSALKSKLFFLKLNTTKSMLCVVSISASPRRPRPMKSAKRFSPLSVFRSRIEGARWLNKHCCNVN